MKKYLLLLAFVMLLVPGPLLAQAGGQNRPGASVLTNIQRKITWGTPADSLRSVAVALDELRAKSPNPYLSYWGAFTQYHLYFRVREERATAEKALQKGIDLLEEIPTKTTEHYALLSLLQGLNLEFASFLTIPFKAATVKENAEKALSLAPDNLRAHYALGINDFYTPSQYGGGKLAAQHFKKAIALPEKADPNPYAPDWGKADAYSYLAQAYKKAGQLELAKKCAAEGLAKYPNHGQLKSLVAKL